MIYFILFFGWWVFPSQFENEKDKNINLQNEIENQLKQIDTLLKESSDLLIKNGLTRDLKNIDKKALDVSFLDRSSNKKLSVNSLFMNILKISAFLIEYPNEGSKVGRLCNKHLRNVEIEIRKSVCSTLSQGL